MLRCFSSTSSGPTLPNQPSFLQVNSPEDTPRSSALQSPNVTKLFSLAVESSPYNNIRSKIQVIETWQATEINDQQHLLLEQILQPNQQHVQEALCRANPSVFTDLASDYFDYSEETCHRLLRLQLKVCYVRSYYGPISNLLKSLPPNLEFLSESQCDHAFGMFLQFDSNENPFTFPGPHSFRDMQCCFSEIKDQIDYHLHRSRPTKPRFIRGSRSISGVRAVDSAVSVIAHALVSLVAISFPGCLSAKLINKEITLVAQLDAAKRSVYVLHHLDTMDRLVDLLYTAVDGDKFHARFVLRRGKDKHAIYEVVKKMRETHVSVLRQIADLESHICLCFDAFNRARSLLLEELRRTHKPNVV